LSNLAGGKMIALRLLVMKNNENQENLPWKQTAPFFDAREAWIPRIEIPLFSAFLVATSRKEVLDR